MEINICIQNQTSTNPRDSVGLWPQAVDGSTTITVVMVHCLLRGGCSGTSFSRHIFSQTFCREWHGSKHSENISQDTIAGNSCLQNVAIIGRHDNRYTEPSKSYIWYRKDRHEWMKNSFLQYMPTKCNNQPINCRPRAPQIKYLSTSIFMALSEVNLVRWFLLVSLLFTESSGTSCRAFTG